MAGRVYKGAEMNIKPGKVKILRNSWELSKNTSKTVLYKGGDIYSSDCKIESSSKKLESSTHLGLFTIKTSDPGTNRDWIKLLKNQWSFQLFNSRISCFENIDLCVRKKLDDVKYCREDSYLAKVSLGGSSWSLL